MDVTRSFSAIQISVTLAIGVTPFKKLITSDYEYKRVSAKPIQPAEKLMTQMTPISNGMPFGH